MSTRTSPPRRSRPAMNAGLGALGVRGDGGGGRPIGAEGDVRVGVRAGDDAVVAVVEDQRVDDRVAGAVGRPVAAAGGSVTV